MYAIRSYYDPVRRVLRIDQQVADGQRRINLRRQRFAQTGVGRETVEHPHERHFLADMPFEQFAGPPRHVPAVLVEVLEA